MNVTLWIAQVILAAMFAASGLSKLMQPKEKLAEKYPWARDFPQSMVWFIGAMEVLGAIGLIAPAASGIAPVLTPIAATGLAALTASAAAMHLRRKERKGMWVTGILFLLSAFVAWGRFAL